MAPPPQPQTFSVIIPLYNKRDHVRRCIQSVLAQTFAEFEVIVVNDASTDGSEAEVLRCSDSRINLVQRSSSGPGPGPARNLGVRHARTDWCAFLDADDAWDPEYLEQMAQAIEELPSDVGFLFSGFRNLYHDGVTRTDGFSEGRLGEPPILYGLPDFADAWIHNHNSPNRTSATIIRRDILLEIGGFPEDERCKRGEDKDTWLRAIARTRGAYVPIVGMTYLTDIAEKKSQAAASQEMPCLCTSLETLLSASDEPVKKLLRRLHNDEILSAAKEISRTERVELRILRGFHVAVDPMKFVVVLGLCLLPRSIASFLRRQRRVYLEAIKDT